MGQVGRLFLAVDLSSNARHALAARLEATIQGRLPGKVVPPPNWHVTLRFLGDVDQVGRDRLLMELAGADLGSIFELTLDRLGAFPKEKRASVLWAGGAGGEARLDGLAGVVEESAEAAGFKAEERPFHPHVTLSRIRPPQDVTRLIADTGDLRVRTRVDAVTLFRSHLARGGAHYETLERFELVNP